MTDLLLHIIDSYHEMESLDLGNFARFKAKGVSFSAQAFTADGLGHIFVLRGRRFFGLMRMDTVVINPFYLDLPLYCYDRAQFLLVDKLAVELYNTVVSDFCSEELYRVKRQYSYLKERGIVRKWYDSLKLPSGFYKKSWAKKTRTFDKLTADHVAAYLAASGYRPVQNVEEKKEKSANFLNLLLTNGSATTYLFEKKFGKEKAQEFFKKYVFGIE